MFVKLMKSTELWRDNFNVFLSISFANLVLDKVTVSTCVLLSVNYQRQTISLWINS